VGAAYLGAGAPDDHRADHDDRDDQPDERAQHDRDDQPDVSDTDQSYVADIDQPASLDPDDVAHSGQSGSGAEPDAAAACALAAMADPQTTATLACRDDHPR
jgi:hypothetical protein